VSLGAASWPHLVQHDADARLGGLEGCFASGETPTYDMDLSHMH
jgi:hypothetical protein